MVPTKARVVNTSSTTASHRSPSSVVIRVWNNEVLGQMDGVLAFIRLSLQ